MYGGCTIAAASTEGRLSALLLAAASVTWGMQWPITSQIVNSAVPSDKRATVISVMCMLGLVFGPLVSTQKFGLWCPRIGRNHFCASLLCDSVLCVTYMETITTTALGRKLGVGAFTPVVAWDVQNHGIVHAYRWCAVLLMSLSPALLHWLYSQVAPGDSGDRRRRDTKAVVTGREGKKAE